MSSGRHPLTDDGVRLDATFDVEAGPLEIVFHHWARGKGTPGAINTQYADGLEVLLQRLGALGAHIERIEVDSSVGRRLPSDQRLVPLDYPVALRPATNIHELRLRITEGMR